MRGQPGCGAYRIAHLHRRAGLRMMREEDEAEASKQPPRID